MTREEAVKVIDGRFEIMDYCENAKLEEALDLAIELLKQPEGKWIERKDSYRSQLIWVECSKCGYESIIHYNFCPYCGCDMREGKKDETY